MAIEHVDGLGGAFFRANDPEALGNWYETHFGIPVPNGQDIWITSEGPLVFSPFENDTDYFGTSQPCMFNFRINDLDAFLDDLAKAGVKEVKEREAMEGIGKFAWIADPEGNRIELWEPAEA